MVVWTHAALLDLKNIHDYIARDSKKYAERVADEITTRSDLLLKFPELGKVVSEFGQPNVREYTCYSYRVIYQIRENVEILAVVHARRLLDENMMK